MLILQKYRIVTAYFENNLTKRLSNSNHLLLAYDTILPTTPYGDFSRVDRACKIQIVHHNNYSKRECWRI